jgi:predicted ArsR family transcriptional regulator
VEALDSQVLLRRPNMHAIKPKPQTKSDTVLALLGRAKGASLDEISKSTSWQPHSARAFLSALRKKGHNILKTSRDGATCYHIAPEKIGDQS